MSADASQQPHSIGSLSLRFGVSLRALRFYEERGLLHPVLRDHQRYFSDRDVVRLQIILLAKRFGFSLREIRELIETRTLDNAASGDASTLGLAKDELEAKIQMLMEQRDDLTAAINELRLAKMQDR